MAVVINTTACSEIQSHMTAVSHITTSYCDLVLDGLRSGQTN